MVKLKNGIIECEISELGAELQSLKAQGREIIWCGDPAVWSGRAPVMFPICGGLKEDRYELDGESYTLSKHGFAKLMTFEVEKNDGVSALFALHSNEQTRKSYPFDFVFRVSFTLVGATLKVTYEAENCGDAPMYASFGAHEAYATPEGIEEYEIVFPEAETLTAYALNGNLLTDYTKTIITDSKVLPLKDEYFYLDALVFRGLKSRSAALVHKNSGKSVNITFDGHDYFLLWHKYGAKYICLEPWCGVQDVAGTSFNIKEKEGIMEIMPGETLSRTHTITAG